MARHPILNGRMVFLFLFAVLIGINTQVLTTNYYANAQSWDISYSQKWGSACLLESMVGCREPISPLAGSESIGNGQFWGLWGIASDDSFVYTLDVLNHRVQKFDINGIFINKWGSKGVEDGQFNFPSGIAVDLQYVYVVDHGNRIQIFTKDGEFLKAIGGTGMEPGMFNSPEDIDVDYTGHIYVADTKNNRIQVLSFDNSPVIVWGTPGTGVGQFQYPQGISVSSPGHVYVTDLLNNRIQYFELVNTCRVGTTEVVPGVCFVKEWGKQGSADGEFQAPTDIDVSGPVAYVADSKNNRIQLFSTDGTFLGKFGSECLLKTGVEPSPSCVDSDGLGPLMLGDGQFMNPSAVSARANTVYVADSINDRVQKLSVNIGTLPSLVSVSADAGEDQTVNTGDKLRLNGENSTPNDGTLKFFWRQISGNENVDLTNPDSVNPTFDTSKITKDSTLEFELQVTNSNNQVDTDTVSIKVTGQQNQKPQAEARAEKNVLEGSTTELDGTESTDEDGKIESYQWHATGCSNDEPKGSIQDSSDSKATFVAPQISGNSTSCSVDLEIRDDGGDTDSDTVKITVKSAVNNGP